MPNPLIDDLAPRVLHGIATNAERTTLADLLAESSINRQRFLEHSSLHSQLAHAAKAGSLALDPAEHFRSLEIPPTATRRPRILKLWLPSLAAAIAACIAIMALLPLSATAALNRVISASKLSIDRTYRIEVLDSLPPNTASTPRIDRGRFPPGQFLDHATLWLRNPNQFVLRQQLPNSETRFLGSNGTQSWSKRGNNPVEISSNPDRFGGGLLAKNRDLAFVDPQSQLPDLQSSYSLEWLDRSNTSVWKLRATRHSANSGGAKEIELWFAPHSGELQRMILHQLPRDHGGPTDIAIILESTDPLHPDFFTPNFPHSP